MHFAFLQFLKKSSSFSKIFNYWLKFKTFWKVFYLKNLRLSSIAFVVSLFIKRLNKIVFAVFRPRNRRLPLFLLQNRLDLGTRRTLTSYKLTLAKQVLYTYLLHGSLTKGLPSLLVLFYTHEVHTPVLTLVTSIPPSIEAVPLPVCHLWLHWQREYLVIYAIAP